MESNIGLDFYGFLTPFIIFIGILGNSISLVIFRKRQLRKLSASLYLSAICISDTCVLLTYVLLDWLNKGLPRWPGGARVQVINIQGLCQVFMFVSYTFRIISVWLIIVFTFERYVAICWPFQRRLICTRSFSIKMIISVSVIACLLSLYKPLIVNVNITNEVKLCTKAKGYEDLNFTLDSIYGVMITAVPFILITLFNIQILRRLVCRTTEHMEVRSISTDSKMRLEFTFILLSISTCFVCLNMPYFILWCKRFSEISTNENSQNGMLNLVLTRTSVQQNTNRSGLLITRTIFYLNYSINFFLYSLTGKQYRKYMKQLLCCHGEERLRCSTYRSSGVTHSCVINDRSLGVGSTAL